MPWINISTYTDGSIKPCPIARTQIKKQNGKAYNFGHDKIVDIYNSEEYIAIRQKMLDGELVDACSACYLNEKYGNDSRRQLYNSTWMTDPKVVEKVKHGPIVDTTIYEFDLRSGNLCNLSCRSCIPENSSQLKKELSEIADTNIRKFFNVISTGDYTEWYETDTFYENFKHIEGTLRQVYLTGGEPTIIKKNHEILQSLIDTGQSKEINLVFNTNMTSMNSKFYSMLPHFKSIVFFASIDGYGPVQEYLRYPSDWTQIDKNVRRLLEMDNIIIYPFPVIQAMNLNNIVELFEYFEQFNRKLNRPAIQIRGNLLDSPSFLNMEHLPLEYKQMCWERIEDWIKNKSTYQTHTHFQKLMNGLKAKCSTNSYDSGQVSKFFEFNEIFDAHRNHYLKDINPELYALKV